MHATYRQLQIVLALAEHGSISDAARACHVSQPTVSMQLREVSQRVGLPIHEVIGKRVHLTAAGEEFVRSARAVHDEWAAFGERISLMKGVASGHLRIAVVSTAEYFVPRMLGAFCQRHPGIDIALQVLNRDGVIARLRDNKDDIYIMSMPPADVDTDCEAFMDNPLVLVARIDHPLARRRGLSLHALQNERFILREPGSGTRQACERHFAEHGFTPGIRMELGSNEAIKQAVAGGLGIAVLSRHALGTHLEDDKLMVLKTREFPIPSHWYIVTLRDKRLSPSAVAFLRQLRGE
jgi:LysR family transcriptional regulator, low CO2-responsive transcriptional regulator